jgi:hypothetical protein
MNISQNYSTSLSKIFESSDGLSGLVTPVQQTGPVHPDPNNRPQIKHDNPHKQKKDSEDGKELDQESKDPKKKKLRDTGYKYTVKAGSGVAVTQDRIGSGTGSVDTFA